VPLPQARLRLSCPGERWLVAMSEWRDLPAIGGLTVSGEKLEGFFPGPPNVVGGKPERFMFYGHLPIDLVNRNFFAGV